MPLQLIHNNLVNILYVILAIDSNAEIFDWGFSLQRLALFILIFVLGILLAFFIPNQIGISISQYLFDVDAKTGKRLLKLKDFKELEKKHREELKRQIDYTLLRPIRNLVGIIIFSAFGLIAFHALGYSFDTQFEYSGYSFTIRQFIVFILILIIFALFIKTTLSPLIRVILYVFLGRTLKGPDLNQIHNSLKRPFVFAFILIAIHSAFYLTFPFLWSDQNLPLFKAYIFVLRFFSILVGIYLGVALFLALFHVTFTIPRKMDTHASVAFENLVKVVAFLVGLGALMVLMGVDWVAIAGAMTFIGFAIAFGMQNTIANIMAGFALAADKPFRIGDRIRVGPPGRETWGDVVSIGINTTAIRTVEEESVVIPNAYIASNEVWNYTRDSPVIVETFDIGISYGSSWRLAKKIILEEAEKHPYVLRNPSPFARTHGYEDFSIILKVWVWIRNARDKDQVRSDLLEAIKDRFDAEGVEIPFPYRTVVYKKDIPKEKEISDGIKFDNLRRYESKGREYYELGEGPLKGVAMSKVVHEEDVKILTPVSGMHNAKRLAQYSMSLARKVNGNVTAIYIMSDASKEKELLGFKTLSIFEQFGNKYNINVASKLETGDIVEKILETIEKDRINLVVIGGGRKGLLGKFGESIANEITERSTVPVVTMPQTLKWY